MYTSVHSVAGVWLYLLITKSFGWHVFWAYFIVFSSHHFIDHFGETGCYDDFYKGVIIDGLILSGLVCLCAYHVLGYEALVCIILANGMDFIDKFRLKILKLPQSFPCHQKKHKMLYKFSDTETFLINIILTFTMLIFLICFDWYIKS